MDITKEQIEKMATEYAKQFDYAEDSSPFLDFIAGFEKALSLFAVSGSSAVNRCNECSKELESGTVFCSADCRQHYYH